MFSAVKKRITKRPQISITNLTLLVSMYVGIVLNLPFYLKVNDIVTNMPDIKIGMLISLPIFFVAAFSIILSLFSWHFMTKIVFIVVVVTSSLACFATLNYGTYFDYGMIENTFQTNSSEVGSYVNFNLIRWFILIGLLPAALILWCKIDYSANILRLIGNKLALIITAVITLALIAGLYFKDYASIGRNNSHLNKLIVGAHLYNTYKYVDRNYLSPKAAFKTMGQDAKLTQVASNGKPNLLVFLLGETARSMNYQANGYPRATNPFTEKYNMLSFNNVSACGTATAYSLPCMFSNYNHDNYNRDQARNQDNVLDVLGYAGIKTFWKENDGGSKGVASRLDYMEIDPNSGSENCNGNTCYDVELLANFDQDISNIASDNKILALHMIGSHGPTYWQRYPPNMSAFKPACNLSDIENCSDEQIVNTYDNTIRYTDFVTASVIEKLKTYEQDYNTAVIYISDHGESLGENGLFLHGAPYKLAPEEQTKVPLMMWFSDSFAQGNGINQKCLQQNAKTVAYSHDNLFHSLLGLMNVSTSLYNKELDMFNNCRI